MPKKTNFTVSDLSKFIAREALKETEQVKRIVEGDTEEALITGDVLGPLRPSAKEDKSIVLRGDKIYFSRFRVGDRVELAEINPRTKKFKSLQDISIKMIRFPKPGVIEVLFSGDEFLLDLKKDVFLLPKSMSSIKWLLRKKLEDIESSGVVASYKKIEKQSIRQNFNEITKKLNLTQKEALRFLVENDLKGLVQGPPGTGKTQLLVDLARLAIKSNLRVGLASLTNTAVDNALARIIDSGVATNEVVRIAGDKQSIRVSAYKGLCVDEIWGGSFRKLSASSEFEEVQEFKLTAATLHAWCLSKNTPEIDVLIIDEASQVPIYFYPFLKLICSRIIMFGDHKQLPPVISITKHNLPSEDIFSYEIEQANYPMLETQYRMNQGVQEWSSNRFYEGKLHPHESNRNRDLIYDLGGSSFLGSKVVNLQAHNGQSSNNANKLEASRVADLVWELNTKGSIPLEEIGIVTPHRSQAGAICAFLQEKLGILDAQKILVDTVERFQGQEKEAMLFSMAVEKDSSLRGDHGFLGDGRRLNVAVTRAKSRFYCIAPTKLLNNIQVQKNANHLKSFLDWCATSSFTITEKHSA